MNDDRRLIEDYLPIEAISPEASREKSVRNPLDKPDAEPLRIQTPAKHLDHAKKEVVAARYFDIPAEAIERAAMSITGVL